MRTCYVFIAFCCFYAAAAFVYGFLVRDVVCDIFMRCKTFFKDCFALGVAVDYVLTSVYVCITICLKTKEHYILLIYVGRKEKK
jgi:hypothetical protein